jgi:hypothetical protein
MFTVVCGCPVLSNHDTSGRSPILYAYGFALSIFFTKSIQCHLSNGDIMKASAFENIKIHAILEKLDRIIFRL